MGMSKVPDDVTINKSYSPLYFNYKHFKRSLMVANAMDFIKNILTDMYDTEKDMKKDALQVYTMLIQSNQEPAVLTFPFSGEVLSIHVAYYNEVLRLYHRGEKISAIKTLRCNGWIGEDKNSGPGLKFAKEFGESLPLNN